jgi:hypothetical protein
LDDAFKKMKKIKNAAVGIDSKDSTALDQIIEAKYRPLLLIPDESYDFI